MDRRSLAFALLLSACRKSEAPVAVAPPIPAVPVIPAVPIAPAPTAAPTPTPTPAPTEVPPTPTGGLEVSSSNPNFGTKTLAPGFVPDPNTTQIVSGGNIDVSTLPDMPPGCAGWVTARPDLVLNLSGTSNNLRLFVRATEQGGDTTLVINDGSGRWHCNDDVESGNLNPLVDIANAPAGHYDIWIGSYAQDARVAGTLNITELSSNRP